MYDELLSLLLALDGVHQDPRYHPEGDALFHSIQVFECALRETDDWQLLAAALLHDVGKALHSKDHDEVGADLLSPLLPARVTWLVRHHLDLLRHPTPTRRRLHGTAQLDDLARLRRWDLAGRVPNIWVPTAPDSLTLLMNKITDATRDDHPAANAGVHDYHEELY